MSLAPRLARVVEAARSKKAFRIRLLDVSGLASFTDTFAFMSGGSDRQNRAIADAVEETLKHELGERPISSEGSQNGSWILLDYGDLIVHVMDEDTRASSSSVMASMITFVASVSVALSSGRPANALRSTGSPTSTRDVFRGKTWNRLA
jgi:ribosome-associated protein